MSIRSKVVLDVENVSKVYGSRKVVNGVSFQVCAGDIFAIIGPNGAGKTTTIRMIMDIIKPDCGIVKILGYEFAEQTKKRVGYLPEERGLYKKLPVMDTIKYLASLKGLSSYESEKLAKPLLKRMGLYEHRFKKIEELSRGMGQFIQFAVTIIHNPDLIILDEPFSGLDPVNAELLKEIIFDLRDQGRAIVLSTHQMTNVEELCDRLLMINTGEVVLYGNVQEIKKNYAIPAVFVRFSGSLENINGVSEIKKEGDGISRLLLKTDANSKTVLNQIIQRPGELTYFTEGHPRLQEIFIKVAGSKTRE